MQLKRQVDRVAIAEHHALEAETSDICWFAVSTRPRNEARALTNLERQGWRCFCPLISGTTRSGRRLITLQRPLFPGYLFVAIDPLRGRWRAIDSTFGVRSVVTCGDAPAKLPSGCIETLMSMADHRGVVSFSSTLIAGEQVKFMSGPFTGFIGKLANLDASGRVTVLLDLLGRDTPIRGYAAELVPVTT